MNFKKFSLLLLLIAISSFNFYIGFAQESNTPSKQDNNPARTQIKLENGYNNHTFKNNNTKNSIKSSTLGVNSRYLFSKDGHKLGHTFLKTGMSSAIDQLKEF